MDYASFVGPRLAIWDRFESGLEALRRRRRLGYDEVEELATDYRRVLHDHALASARFPRTNASRRLRRLVLEGARSLSWTERPGWRELLADFVWRRFPNTFRRQLPALGVVTLLFLVGTLSGLTLIIVRPGLSAWIVGPRAVRDLAEGRLWVDAITATVPGSVSSSAIATNNISVALTGFAGGALAGLGSLYVAAFNGVHLGAVLAVTSHYSMQGRLLEFVAAHGPLEITLILVCAGAGLVLARGLVEAGDRSRGEMARQAAGEALVLLGGCLPWFVLLGVVEAFLSPSTAVGGGVKAAVGLSLELLFLSLALGRSRSTSIGDAR